MSKWRFGCGVRFETTIPRGYSYRTIEVECGSTSYTGGVNQCDKCADEHPVSEPLDDEESDMNWFERQGGDDY